MFIDNNERATAHLAAIIESSDDAIVSKDLDGIIQSWNYGAERLFGYSAHEVIGKSITLVIPPELHDEETIILSRIRSGDRIHHFETVRQDKWGKKIDVSLTVSPIKDKNGVISGASKIARDISEQKRMERELQQMNDRKDEFLAILSHELRNPLAAIRGGLDLLHRSDYQPSVMTHAFAIMERQTDHVIHLIEQLLDITRINQGTLTIQKQPMVLQQAVSMGMESCHELNKNKQHHFIVQVADEPIFILGDLNRVAQIVNNVISNAIKYTPANGKINIIVEKSGQEAHIKVQDNGKGMPREQLETAFEMFHRVESDSHYVDGLGVGLGIAKKLVEMHGGEITPYSDGHNKGCEFVITFPLLERDVEEIYDTNSLIRNISDKRTLL